MFMQELQYLFALMMGSNRKFVDPSAALDLLKGAFRSPEEQQVQETCSSCLHVFPPPLRSLGSSC